MQPHYEKMKSSMQPYYEKMKSSIQSSNGSSMGFSQLSKNKTDINALEHAQKQAILGTGMQNDPINQRQMYLP
jgi:ABC-type phosphate transport system substrate-binding protein